MIAELDQIEIPNLDQIPTRVLSMAFEKSGLSLAQASAALGWGKDQKRLRRNLGMRSTNGAARTHVEYETAVKMIRAWRLDPVDYGV